MAITKLAVKIRADLISLEDAYRIKLLKEMGVTATELHIISTSPMKWICLMKMAL